MRTSRKNLLFNLFIVTVLIFLFASGCKKDKNDGELGSALSGSILAPDGSTPIAGATVYIPLNATSAKSISVVEADGCPVPSESYLAYTCTNADGSFVLDIASVEETSFTMRVVKGSFRLDVTIGPGTGSNLGNIELPADPALGGGNFAVVTGAYDRMQDILAKLGMGEIDSYYELESGTETFDIYDGDYTFGGEYPAFPALFENDPGTGDPVIYNYQMVFINCGNDYESELYLDDNMTSILNDYVYGGGKLYVTDWSYDFVEQAFPGYIDFFGSDETADEVGEEEGAAEVGDDGITSNAAINDAQLALWLQTVSCQGGSCLNSDNTVPIAGFWPSWAVMNGAHSAKSSDVKIWVSGPVSWYDWDSGDYGSGTKPLTVSFNYGAGKVLYSSYHTEEDNPSDDFWPQERILQYLVFEL
jgi:hypothetical protein